MARLARDFGEMVLALAVAALTVLLVAGCDRPREMPAQPAAAPAAAKAAPKTAPPATLDGRGIPATALRHRTELIRNARSVWGLAAPVAVFAAQVHQESGWRADAKSPVGARGMAQFMPSTADWLSGLFPELAANEPYNPSWALRALVTYDHYLWDRLEAVTPCDRMAFALSAYNGGLGWVRRDSRLAASRGLAPDAWWDNVEAVNAGRSVGNWRENRGYPKRILRTLTPRYVAAGYGEGICHE